MPSDHGHHQNKPVNPPSPGGGKLESPKRWEEHGKPDGSVPAGHDQLEQDRRAAEQVIIGRATIIWSEAGFLAGAAVGLIIGLALGYGRIAIAGLAPLAAGGAGVPGFIFSVFFGSLFGLIGAMLGTAKEARAVGERPPRRIEVSHGEHRSGLIQKLPIAGSVGLAALMAYTLFVIAGSGFGTGEASDQSNRITWNQKNVSRVGGATDAETASHVLHTAYPATRPENSPGVVVVVKDDWRMALAATPLVSRPTNAAVLIIGTQGVDTATRQEIARLGTPAILGIGVALDSAGQSSIGAEDPASVAAAIDERLAADLGAPSTNVMVVNMDVDHRWAIPAGAYAARTGTPVLFVSEAGVPQATQAALARRSGNACIFILGPDSAIPKSVIDSLRSYGAHTRIDGDDPIESAVRFAEFRDEAADFGWGHTGLGTHQSSVTNTILVNGSRWQDGVMASHLARAGKPGPILFSERDHLPAVVDNHLWRQRPVFSSTPAEGPFNHIWAVGSFDQISYQAQAWADYSQEIEQYMTLGDSAVSGFEALGIGWIVLSIASSMWIVYHSLKRLPDAMPVMKAAWAVLALLLGPLALVLYVKSYNRRQKMERDGMVMWMRPTWAQVVSATVMMFSFDMMLMVLAVFFVAYFGFPIIRMTGPLYWLGSSMFLMMVLMYVIALIAMMLVFHTPMSMHERGITSYWKGFMAGFPIMLATMTVESLGMMPTMWWAQMLYLPAMQMPTEDDFTMWTTLLMAVAVGFVVVLPFNYWMVKSGRKMGTM